MAHGIGFKVVTEVLLVEDGTGDPGAAVINEKIRGDMAKLFLDIIQAKVPEFAEAHRLRVEDVQLGCTIFLVKKGDKKPQGFG